MASHAKDHDVGGAASCGAVYLVFCPRAPSFSIASLSIRGLDTLALSSSSPGANKKIGIDYRGGGKVTVSYSCEQLAAGL
ncbi:hypothetical protein E2562_019087 [Oryza meyeriana var. granulata]|uniref:Uncharacterized protein n=1 Tax=Oryza meyeriana var. granulata TaxID=110450 RepID=A0A6G1CSB5_9ORYZ|nr:hypothetical protein E2562_019087 [Oryza meyeriana var. granulata]